MERHRAPGPGGGTDGRPVEIFLSCAFGTSAWTPPRSLAQEAAERLRRDEGVVRAQWVRNGAGFRMTRFEVELHEGGSASAFRSSNFGDDLADLDFSEVEVAFPATARSPLQFRISASVPRRTNRGEAMAEPRVALTLAGTAEPIPPWLLY